ncbi:DinB family protein [Hymenobacter negativus]|uniref:Damage-inducible protein DinB n=1 Tax=Hymenobacter negativus TaxID=2795026 RepID=A0ABS0Q824_9BACT|nr:DinB family protein [Hymenobacter negativus]MBH8558832.1 damage-inducible protein DinB [Hymenobacter negativus]
MINTIAKLGAFNVWANETLLRRLDSSAAAGQEIPQPVLRLFSHAINAQCIWIARITGTQSPVKVWQEHDLAGIHHWHEQSSERLRELCEITDEAELGRHIQYTNSQGDAYDSLVSDILTHAVTHATYHRAQAATKMREGGLEPVNSDFITYCREMSGQVQPQL